MPAGRPMQYETVGELEDIIESYFAYCKDNDRFPTVLGLCVELDLTREGLLKYQGREEFSDTIKRAKLRIGNEVEQVLMSGKAPAGAIFNLKNNFGWKDVQTLAGDENAPVKIEHIERKIIDP